MGLNAQFTKVFKVKARKCEETSGLQQIISIFNPKDLDMGIITILPYE